MFLIWRGLNEEPASRVTHPSVSHKKMDLNLKKNQPVNQSELITLSMAAVCLPTELAGVCLQLFLPRL